jgi:hypothetical protein
MYFHRVLDVAVLLRPEDTSREGISALSKLQSLQEFIFFKFLDLLRGNRGCQDRLSLLMQYCFDLLPHLHIVAVNPEPRMSNKNAMGSITSKALSDLGPRQRTLQLQRLVVSGPVPQHIALPELRFLSVTWPSEPLLMDADRFPRLSELDLQGVCRDELMRVLRLVGRRLQALHFEVHDVVRLDGVLSECPDLSELSVDVFGVHSSTVELQPRSLRRLQKLRVTFADMDYDHHPELLIQILRLAPELRVVNLTLQTVHVEVFEELFLLAKRRTSMQKLEEFKVYVDNHECEKSHRAILGLVLLFCTFECDLLTVVDLVFKRAAFNSSDSE